MYGWESGPESTDLYCNTTEREREPDYLVVRWYILLSNSV